MRAGGLFNDVAWMFPAIQAAAFTLSVVGVALPVARSRRVPSTDAVQEALVVTGAWLLMNGVVASWAIGALGLLTVLRGGPSGWSLVCAPVGLAMLVAGLVGDRRLVGWVRAVRRGERAGWRIEPVGPHNPELPSLLGARGVLETDGLLLRTGDEGALPVALVPLDQDDGRWLVGARVRAVTLALATLALALLVTSGPALFMLIARSGSG